MIKFQKLFSALNNNKVRYMVGGGVAVNLYGIERATADIDIVVHLDENNLLRFIETAKKLGLKPKVPVPLDDFLSEENRRQWIKEKNMIVFSLYDPSNSFFLLDVFVYEPFDFNEVYRRKVNMASGTVRIPVIPVNELIKMKEHTGRPQDIADVYHLKIIESEWKNEK